MPGRRPAAKDDWMNWETIYGAKAAQLAARIARPGTFVALGIKWIGDGKAPSAVRITGTVKCGYCGGRNSFSLHAMTGQVPCAGCGAIYSIFINDQMIDGKDGRVIVASVYSHREGTGIVLPQLDIIDVANEENSTVDEAPTAPRVLDYWDCADRDKVKVFVDGGGDINARDENQKTVLHLAASMDCEEAVRVLLDFGADPNLPVLPGASKRTIEIVRNNRKPNASRIEAMLASGRKQRPLDQKPPRKCASAGDKGQTSGKRWWEFWK